MNTIKTLVNGLKHWVVNRKIDEKQIPESIARVEDVEKTVNEAVAGAMEESY